MNLKKIGAGMFCVLLVVLGFILGRLEFATPLDGAIQSVSEQIKSADTVNSDTVTVKNENTATSPALTDQQKAIAESFGIDPDTVTITPAMIACAEQKVGSARLAEIKDGATPSFLEGAALLTCYK